MFRCNFLVFAFGIANYNTRAGVTDWWHEWLTLVTLVSFTNPLAFRSSCGTGDTGDTGGTDMEKIWVGILQLMDNAEKAAVRVWRPNKTYLWKHFSPPPFVISDTAPIIAHFLECKFPFQDWQQEKTKNKPSFWIQNEMQIETQFNSIQNPFFCQSKFQFVVEFHLICFATKFFSFSSITISEWQMAGVVLQNNFHHDFSSCVSLGWVFHIVGWVGLYWGQTVSVERGKASDLLQANSTATPPIPRMFYSTTQTWQ